RWRDTAGTNGRRDCPGRPPSRWPTPSRARWRAPGESRPSLRRAKRPRAEPARRPAGLTIGARHRLGDACSSAPILTTKTARAFTATKNFAQTRTVGACDPSLGDALTELGFAQRSRRGRVREPSQVPGSSTGGGRGHWPARPGAERLDHRVFGGLDRARAHDLAGGLGLEHRRLLGEGVDPLPLLGGRLLDDHELRESRNQEGSGLLELFVADGGERLEDALHVFAGELPVVLFGQLGNEVGLRQRLAHSIDLLSCVEPAGAGKSSGIVGETRRSWKRKSSSGRSDEAIFRGSSGGRDQGPWILMGYPRRPRAPSAS